MSCLRIMISLLLLVVRLINTQYVEESRPGVCPPFRSDVICSQALIKSDCTGKDSECANPKQKCCPAVCGSFKCQTPITGNRPGCPAINPDLRCIVFRQECNSDRDCEKVCHLPKDPGPCEALFHRYYYDDDSKACFKFTYGGCQGNTNNFQTIEECEERCKRPDQPCKPVSCHLDCDFGLARDDDGCKICKCKEKPQCKPFICTLDCKFRFATDDNGCKLCKCSKKPDCPPVCQIFCPFGNVLDDNGCPTCKCKTEMCPVDSICHDYNRE